MKPKVYLFFKRAFDIFSSLLAIVVAFPVMVVVALLIILESGGPILFFGERSGLYGRSFQIIKFRSMYVGSENGPMSTSKNDVRITVVGAFLRRYKLDELPQLFNILKGEMSIVGPRPELPYYTDQYVGEAKEILNIKPGLTDYASIEYYNLNSVIDDANPDQSYEENVLNKKNTLRLNYVRNMSFCVDTLIIVKTALKFFKIS